MVKLMTKDLVVKHQSLDHRERYFLPLQDLQTGLKLDAGGLYQLDDAKPGDRKNQVVDFLKGKALAGSDPRLLE
jgi:hypothetical protein